jgi:signal transduction histidine kinase/ActR/RegA family two-component response regulator
MGWTNLTRSKLVNLPRGVLISVCALGLLSIAVLWTAIVYVEHADRDAALHQAEAQTQSVAIALREHAHGVISSADLILQRVDDSYARSSSPYALPEWLAQSQFLQETSIQIGVIGADGTALVTTLPGLGKLDLSDREHFHVHLLPGAPQPFISRPVIGRVSAKPSIQITRRIERPDGSFAGVGLVALDPAYFNRFFESINLGPNSLIYLIGRDGVLRARSSRAGPNIGVGQDFSGNAVMKTLLSASQGTYRAHSDLDGIERVYAYAADSRYPLIVGAGMAIDDVLGAHRSTAIVQFAAGAVLSAVILWLVYHSVQELSRRIEQERHLRQAQKFEAIGQLTAGVAHDFNNILTAIKGNAERAYLSKTDDLRRLLSNVEQAARQGERIVSSLLAYSRQQRLLPEAVDVNDIVRTVTELLRAGLGARWTVRSELAPNLPLVTADAIQAETALLNLAINARDAMPAGGTVIFETKLVEAGGASKPHDLAAGSYVAISAKDSGIGMSADIAAKAFDPFFTTKEKGTGLGLSQVYGLGKQLGGTVTIDTALQNGTTVTIYLPVTVPQIAPSQIATTVVETPVTNSRAPTVLVADDNTQVREFMCWMLADAGYRLSEAHDGPSALEALSGCPFDLAVLDVSMPGLSGIDVYERACQNGWRGAVLFVSGFADPTIVARIHGKPFLAKPFGIETLRDQVARLLAGRENPLLASRS